MLFSFCICHIAESKSACFVLGQEGATIDCDEGVPITPFNLDEEMQEGHFDSEGNYYVKKDEEIRDNWLDNIDWVTVFSYLISCSLQKCHTQFSNVFVSLFR